MSELIKFYRDEPNHSGYTWSYVMSWDDRDWDLIHDFVQWVFPTDEASEFNPEAPVLDKRDAARFWADGELSWRFAESVGRARQFLAMKPWASAGPAWWDDPDDHNVRRVSRIVRSVALLRGEAEARAFMRDAWAVCKSAPRESLEYWRKNAEVYF